MADIKEDALRNYALKIEYENEELKNTLKEKENLINTLREEIERYKQTIEIKDKELNDLNDTFVDLNTEYVNKLNILNSIIAKYEADYNAFKEKRSSANKAINELNSAIKRQMRKVEKM